MALQVFAVEQIESTKLDFELVRFVRCPIIEVCAFVSRGDQGGRLLILDGLHRFVQNILLLLL